MEGGGTQLFGQVMQQEALRNQIYQDPNSSGDHNRIQSEFSVKHLLMQKFSSKDLKSSEERPQRHYEVEPKILVNEGPDTNQKQQSNRFKRDPTSSVSPYRRSYEEQLPPGIHKAELQYQELTGSNYKMESHEITTTPLSRNHYLYQKMNSSTSRSPSYDRGLSGTDRENRFTQLQQSRHSSAERIDGHRSKPLRESRSPQQVSNSRSPTSRKIQHLIGSGSKESYFSNQQQTELEMMTKGNYLLPLQPPVEKYASYMHTTNEGSAKEGSGMTGSYVNTNQPGLPLASNKFDALDQMRLHNTLSASKD